MPSAVLLSLSEYLATSYQPDQEYIDGQLVERHVGEWDHSWLQIGVLRCSIRNWEPLGFLAMPELRVQVKPTRFRIPDITVVRQNPGEQILTRPPLICIEVLSPDDSMSSMQEKIDDYLQFGVENIWIIDPRRKKAFWADRSGIHESPDALLQASGAPVSLDLSTLWPS